MSTAKRQNIAPRISLIEGAFRKFSMDFNDIIPFVDYFINYCSSDEAKEFIADSLKIRKQKEKRLKGWTSENENWNWTLEGAKKSMISYKNSLIILKHFKARK